MTVGAILSRTATFFFRKLNFDYPFWHTYEHQNWDDLDNALQGIISSSGVVGAWTNNILATVGERYIDITTGNPYICAVTHTTAPTGTFADERTAHPTYWTLVTIANNAVTFAQLQDISTKTFLGRLTAGSGDPEALSVPSTRAALGVIPHGQCSLDYVSTTEIRLRPKNGNRLIIGDAPCSIPSAGVALAPTGLTANTDYYVYAVDSNADEIVDTLETALVSAGTATDATTGVRIKSGDRTRTLVGLVRPVAGPLWENTKPFVRSYFNRRQAFHEVITTSDRTFTNTGTGALIHSALRAEFIMFADDVCVGYLNYTVSNSGNNKTFILPVFDATIAAFPQYSVNPYTDPITLGSMVPFTTTTEGYHYLDVYGSVSAGTGKVNLFASALNGRTIAVIG